MDPSRLVRAFEREEMNVVLLIDADFIIRFANEGVRTILGYEPEELVGRSTIELTHPDDLAATAEATAFEVAHPGPRALQKVSLFTRVKTKDGSYRYMEPTGTNLLDDPIVQGFVLVLADAESRSQLDAVYGLIASGATLHDVLAGIARLVELEQRWLVAVAITPPHGDAVTGSGAVPSSVATWSPATDRSAPGSTASTELHAWFEPGRAPSVYERRGLDRAAALAQLAFDRAHAAEALRRAARTDALTQLANRTAFNEGMATIPNHALSALILVDLDGFKAVNDGHGHAAGDAVLIAVSDRVREVVRHGDLVARIGGDEFAVLCANVPDADSAMRIANAVAEAVRAPILAEGHLVEVRASIGVCAPIPTHDVDAALRRADEALYRAKRGGRDQVVLAS